MKYNIMHICVVVKNITNSDNFISTKHEKIVDGIDEKES